LRNIVYNNWRIKETISLKLIVIAVADFSSRIRWLLKESSAVLDIPYMCMFKRTPPIHPFLKGERRECGKHRKERVRVRECILWYSPVDRSIGFLPGYQACSGSVTAKFALKSRCGGRQIDSLDTQVDRSVELSLSLNFH